MKQLYFDFIHSLRSVDKLTLLFVLIQFSKAVGFLPYIPDTVDYMAIILMSVYAIFRAKTFSWNMMILLAYIACNILICSPDKIFNPWMRFAFFIILLISVSPLVQSEYLRGFRRYMLNSVLWIGALLSMASFFCRFLGINFMLGGTTNYSINTTGTFAGLFNQSMILGPFAGMSTIFLAHQAYKYEDKSTRIWYIIAALICLLTVLFSASRSALLCTIAGVSFMLMKAVNNNAKFIKLFVFITIIAALTFPVWNGALEGVIAKNDNNLLQGSATASRDAKWNARITEFESSPVCGIGFSSVDSSLDDVSFGGTIEPGSSWLAILSMTGIIGTILFIIIFWKAYKGCNLLRSSDDALLLGLLVLFVVHMMAEGYVFAAGSTLCFVLWLVVGCCVDRNYE